MLEQSQESCNHRYEQEQENGLQDAHHPRIVVDPIVDSFPHFGLPYVYGVTILGLPAGLPMRDQLASLSRLPTATLAVGA